MSNTNLMNMNRQELSQLRFTVEGHVCTTSCEMLDGKESCLYKNKEGALNRGFCREILDYDAIRKNLAEHMKEVTDLETVTQTELNEQVKLLQIENTNYTSNWDKYVDFSNKNDWINNTLLNVDTEEKKIQKMKVTYTELAQQNMQLSLKLGKYIEELKLHGNQYECSASKGYDVYPIGTGLAASYFDNVYFEGTPSTRIEKEIKLTFIDAPIKGINPYNFSLKLEGFIRAPISGYYIFSADSDDGTMIKVNNDPILRDRFLDMNFKDWLEQLKENITESLGKSSYVDFVRSYKESQNGDNKKSKEIYMNANELYYFEVFYRHSVHNSSKQTNDVGKLHLYWESPGQIPKRVLAKEFLYDNFVKQNLKLNNYSFDMFERVYLYNNQQAFKDSPLTFISDVPIQLHGALFLRSNQKFSANLISFTCSAECIVYLVVPREDASILPDYFIDENYEMSLMTVKFNELDRFKAGMTTEIYTRDERPLKVFRYNYPVGKVEIPLHFDTIIPDSHVMVFADFDIVNYNPLSCGGQILRLTDSSLQNREGIPIYSKCIASTSKDNEHLCSAAFSNDSGADGWITDPKKADGDDYIEIFLNQAVWPNYLQIYQTGVEQKKILKMKLEYNDDNFEIIEVDASISQPEVITVQLKKVVSTNKMKFTIIETNKADLEHMLLINVFGTLCSSINSFLASNNNQLTKLDRLYGSNFRKPIYLNCSDNLNSLSNYNIVRGEDLSIWISCNSGCIKQTKIAVVGGGPFAEQSGICKTARYKGIIGDNGGSFKLYIQPGLKEYEKAETQHGIDSETGKATRKSFVVKKYDESNVIVVTAMAGMEIEVNQDGKWKEGVIKEVVSETQIKYTLKLDPTIEGEAQWPPDKKLTALCGTFIKGLICNDASSNSIKINFGPEGNRFNGFLQDIGERIADHDGVVYGWNYDMRRFKKLVLRSGEDPTPMNTYLKFNSDPMSRYCNTTTKSKYLCEKVNWTIKVPNRMYIVKVTVGDLEGQTVQNLQANGTSIISHVLTNKRTYTNMAYVGVRNHQIMLESTCKPLNKQQRIENIPNCAAAWTGIMSVEIIPVYPDAIKSLKNNFRKVCNKNMFLGGRCMDKDPYNCIYNDPYDLGTHLCTEPDFKLIQMPRTDCRESSLKWKCIKLKFASEEQCEKDCPYKCLNNQCIEE